MSLSVTVSNPNPFLKTLKTPSSSLKNLKPNPIPFKTLQFPLKPTTITKCPLNPRLNYVPSRISDPAYVRIFDTTLRDGEQSPGATMTSSEKLTVARHLSRLGVDIIEAGFPASSPDDLQAVQSIAIEVGNQEDEAGYVPFICGLARCRREDIEKAWEAVRLAKRPRIHTFIATSDIHLEHKLKMSREKVVGVAREMVAFARSLGCVDIEFSPEDAGRSDREFLYHILGEVIKVGATTLNIPDTVGYTLPSEFGQLIADIKANTPGIENVIISTHCQNDLGLATANTLAGAYGGARQLEVTVNGIGERAGNASLEEVVMAIQCRKELIGGLYTGINTKHISMASKMVAEYTGLHVQPHKAIVGANAFAHESGIHQDGMLKFKGTYEIMSPDDIGLSRSNESGIVLGKLSGRHALKSKLSELGYNVDGKELDDVFKRFKEVAEKKKRIADDDIEALITNELFQPKVIWSLGDLQITSGTLGLSTATVKLINADHEEQIACSVGNGPVDAAYKAVDSIVQRIADDDIEALITNELFQPKVIWSLGDLQITSGTLGLSTATVKLINADHEEQIACSVGNGPVDAAYKAVDSIVQIPVTLLEYSLSAVTEGIDAIATTRVLIRGENSHTSTHALTGETVHRTFSGTGADMDIVVSSVRAYVNALNKMLGFREREAEEGMKSKRVMVESA